MAATPEQWAAARKKYETSVVTGAALANELGVSGAAVSKTIAKQGWVKFNAGVIKTGVKAVKQVEVNQEPVKLTRRGKPLKHTGDVVTRLETEAKNQMREWNKSHNINKWKEWSASPDALEEFCTYVTEKGVEGSLIGFCNEKGFGISTLHKWIASDPTRVETYARAREGRADVLFDALLGMASKEPERDERGRIDPGWVQWQRLIVDTGKWAAGKLNQGLYGDNKRIEVNGTIKQDGGRDALLEKASTLLAAVAARQNLKLPGAQDVTDVEPKRLE